MGYMDNKAPLKGGVTETVEDFKASPKIGSNQQKNAPIPKRTVTVNAAKHNSGNQVRIGANDQNTGVLKDPLTSYKKSVLAVATNPDAGRNRSGNKVAAGKVRD